MSKFANIAAQAALTTDNSVEVKGGGFKDPLKDKVAEGDVMMLRFTGYMETGEHDGPFGVSPQAILDFDVVTPRHSGEKDGKPVHGRIRIYCKISLNSAATFFKMFKGMDYGRGNKVFPQMLGQGFLAKAHWIGEGDAKKLKIVTKDFCTIGAPMFQDPMSGDTKPVTIPPASSEEKCFMWDSPTAEQWDSIFIEGDNDDGTSKNWIQGLCKDALNFPGSPVEAFLGGGNDLPAPDAFGSQGMDLDAAMNQL